MIPGNHNRGDELMLIFLPTSLIMYLLWWGGGASFFSAGFWLGNGKHLIGDGG